MLHLDHNHTSATLSPHTTPNLILSDTPQPDQHSLLSWSAPAAAAAAAAETTTTTTTASDDEPFKFIQTKDQPLPDTVATPPSQSDAPPSTQGVTDADPPPVISSANADEPKPRDPSPSSPVDATSPAIESTSSLTPPPDSTSPAFPSAALPVEEASTQSNLEQVGEQKGKPEGDTEEVDKASRASTPLSELSSAPDGDDPLPSSDAEKKGGEDEKQVDSGAGQNESQPGGGVKSATKAANEPTKAAEVTKFTNGHTAPLPSKSPVAAIPVATPHRGSYDNQIVVLKQESSDSDSQTQHLATPEPPTLLSTRASAQLDARVVTVLELNAHLLKVSMEFQARGIRLNDSTFQQYGQRLQSNLAWLATTADATRKVSHASMSLPIMQAPPAVEFASMDRINQLYSDLPSLFSKDLMRRQSLTGGGPVPQIPVNINGHLKRERTEDPPGDISNKRRDTGESKMPTPGPGTPSSRHSPSNSISGVMVHPATPPHNISMQYASGVSVGSPAMPPPSLTSGILSNEPQSISGARSRMRVGVSDGNRPMPLASTSSQQGVPLQHTAGPSTLPNGQAQMGASGMNSLPPAVVQSVQILQDSSHPATRYLSAQIPGFTSLPLQQQMQHLHRMQMVMQARKGQGAQHHMGGSMPGFTQGPQNGGIPGQMGVPNGSPTRMSTQQSPMPPHGSFPFGNQGGMDPRTANAMNTANMPIDPQRRQLLLMQQQNIMRNNAMFNAQQQQRLSQQPGASPHIGSPMLGGSPDGNAFPALRSNASVPGIARSTRTPSDHAPSPLTPQLSGRSDDMQRAMMQQGQRNMMHGQGMGQLGMGGMNPSWQQGQQSGQQIPHGQNSYGMTPPGSAGFGTMPGSASSPAGGQQWSQAGGGQFSFNASTPPGQQPPDGNTPGSRQASATPAPHQQQQQMPQNNPMGEQAGLNVGDFDIFNWGH